MKFIIVDDSEYYRKQLAAQVNSVRGYEVIATAQSGRELLSIIQTLKPSIVLADVHLPDGNVMDIAQEVIRQFPDMKFLCITQSNIAEWIYQMQQIGIKGYLYKTSKSANIEKAVDTITLNRFYVDEEVVENLVKQVKMLVSLDKLNELNELNELNDPDRTSDQLSLSRKVNLFQHGGVKFTERELFILSGTRNGTKVTEIVRQLGITTRTISHIKESLRDKLDVKSNPELVPQAMKKGLIQ